MKLQPGIFPFPVLGFWGKNAMPYAGIMAYAGIFRPLPVSSTERGTAKNRVYICSFILSVATRSQRLRRSYCALLCIGRTSLGVFDPQDAAAAVVACTTSSCACSVTAAPPCAATASPASCFIDVFAAWHVERAQGARMMGSSGVEAAGERGGASRRRAASQVASEAAVERAGARGGSEEEARGGAS